MSKKTCKNCGEEYVFNCTNPKANSVGYWKTHCCSPECFVELCGENITTKRGDKLRVQYENKTYTVEYDYKRKVVKLPIVGEVKISKLQNIFLSPHELLEALDFGVETKAKKEAKKSEPKD